MVSIGVSFILCEGSSPIACIHCDIAYIIYICIYLQHYSLHFLQGSTKRHDAQAWRITNITRARIRELPLAFLHRRRRLFDMYRFYFYHSSSRELENLKELALSPTRYTTHRATLSHFFRAQQISSLSLPTLLSSLLSSFFYCQQLSLSIYNVERHTSVIKRFLFSSSFFFLEQLLGLINSGDCRCRNSFYTRTCYIFPSTCSRSPSARGMFRRSTSGRFDFFLVYHCLRSTSVRAN